MRTLIIAAGLAVSVALAAPSFADPGARIDDAARDYRQCMASRASERYDAETFPVAIVKAATDDCTDALGNYLEMSQAQAPELVGSDGSGTEGYVQSRAFRLYEMTFLETLRQVIDRRLSEYR